jgi:hypothetical protein
MESDGLLTTMFLIRFVRGLRDLLMRRLLRCVTRRLGRKKAKSAHEPYGFKRAPYFGVVSRSKAGRPAQL